MCYTLKSVVLLQIDAYGRDGEIDTRSVYTTLAVARVLNLLTPGTNCQYCTWLIIDRIDGWCCGLAVTMSDV